MKTNNLINLLVKKEARLTLKNFTFEKLCKLNIDLGFKSKNFVNEFRIKNKKMYSQSKDKEENIIVNTTIGNIPFLNSENSKIVDDLLMGKSYGYSIDQLIEIAGLSVAKTIDEAIKTENEFSTIKKILNVSGPGSKD